MSMLKITKTMNKKSNKKTTKKWKINCQLTKSISENI